ncbi:laccase, multicopper oxidase, benzenediol:oxygen oxidorectuctase [Teratosphaeriaceae sp. CCFEE 6253]|nr:laccase, multicopper oxidase, benzenediol:oxygen oxidorectuctase [Teratosphaeriaceae sp. CCFEE 6253]
MHFPHFLAVSALALTAHAFALHEGSHQRHRSALEARAGTAICPTYNGKTYTDSNSVAYTVSCPGSNNGAVIGSTGTATNLADCMVACDAKAGCNAANFHTGVNQCYFVGTLGTVVYNATYNCAVKQSASSTKTSTASCTSATSVAVTFNELVSTAFGDSVNLTGSISQLGNWSPGLGVALSASQYTSSNPLWSGTVNLPPGTNVQYKYVQIASDGTANWEADPNHSFVVPTGCATKTTISDKWQQLSTAGSSSTTSLSSVVKPTITATSTTSVAPTSTCTNGPNSRNCWSGGLDINTDFDNNWPSTGRTVSYTWSITNTSLAPDGFKRPVFAINGQYPGPLVEANWGDMISIKVTNNLADNGTSIHWHGIRQFHNNGQDGVPGVTECPLAPGQTKTYTFRATQYGSSWYHSHFSCQYGDGVLGPIIIHGPATANYDIESGALPITDWYYQTVNYHASLAEHQNALPPEADNALINGTMTSPSGGKYYVTPLTAGKRHRVRLMNTAVDNHFVVSLDGHQMQVISADFVPIKPINVTSLFIGIGQRYDVIITADQSPGAYWFRADVQDTAGCGTNFNNGNIRSIFAYAGHTTETPISSSQSYTATCSDQTGLVPYWNSYVPQGQTGTFTELTTSQLQQTETDGTLTVYWQINGSAMSVDWQKPTLEYVQTSDTSYPSVANLIQLPTEGRWVYWVIQEVAGNPYNVAVPHPIHLHGHDFYVLGTGTTTWTASAANSLNYANPTRRDVAMLPTNGWLALAFVTDNPGAWLMHCHIAWHADEGLAVQFLESASTIASVGQIPSDFQSQCNAWDSYYNGNPAYLQHDSGI